MESNWKGRNKPTHLCLHVFFKIRKPKTFNGTVRLSSAFGAGLTGCLHVEECKYIQLTLNKSEVQMEKDINIKPDKLNLIEEKVQTSLDIISRGDDFLNRTPKAQALKETILNAVTQSQMCLHGMYSLLISRY